MTEIRHRDAFPRPVRQLEQVWIPMRDGARLSARVWLPQDAEHDPVPGIVEYIPYRQRDLEAFEDSITQPYFAGHGYGCVRVDLRGSGESDGVLTDEYLEQELVDGEDILRWVASQPWCTGSVGMMGISWGGFNGLQLAARQPPQLQAIVTACSSDDRYADDIHYMGGCLLGDNLSWASTMFAYNSIPPSPPVVGERWRKMWLQRLDGSGLWLENWLRHQRRDAYWKHGSVCEDPAAIRCPVFAVSGWADGYSNSVFRLMRDLEVPRKGLVGPWCHRYPHFGAPGSPIGFLQECLRWWDRWLKGIDTGIMDEPMIRVWMQDARPPSTSNEQPAPGRWVAEPCWPSEHVRPRRLALAPQRLVEQAAPEARSEQEMPLASPLTVGRYGGKWLAYSATPDMPGDQRPDDGGSLVFDTAPLEQPLEILGAPRVELELASDKPVAQVAVRLCDVAPGGASTRVTYGLLNLTHRDSHERPSPLVPGRRYRVKVVLNEVAQTFRPGHRIRLAISSSYWPIAWPPPEPVMLTIYGGASTLELPVRPPRESDDRLPMFGEPEGAPPLDITLVEAGHYGYELTEDLGSGEAELRRIKDGGTYRIEHLDAEVRVKTEERWTHCGNDPTSVRGQVVSLRQFTRAGTSARAVTRTVLSSTPTYFEIEASVEAHEGEEGEHEVYRNSYNLRIPRDLV